MSRPPAVLPLPQVTNDADGRPAIVSFVFPVWQSKKNDVLISRGKVRCGTRSSRHADVMRQHVARIVPHGTVLFGDTDDVHVSAVHNVDDDTVTVTMRRAGAPRQVGRKTGRRRDVHNLLDTLCDAMQGVVYGDDKQVSMASVERWVP